MRHDCGAAGVDAVVLQNETAGRAGHCGSGARRDPDYSGKLSRGIFPVDEEHPRLDAIATALVGAPDPRVALRELQGDYRRPGSAGKVPKVRVGKTGAGSG